MKLERSLLQTALLVILALATTLALVLTSARTTTVEDQARENNLFLSFPHDRLLRIGLRGNADQFVLERLPAADASTDRYELRGQGPADPEASESLIRALELAAFLREFDASATDRAELGLTPPRAEIRVEFEGKTAVLRIGKEALTPHGATYVEAIEGTRSRVGLLRSEAVSELLVAADTLRPRALLPTSLAEFEAIEFQEGSTRVALHRGRGPSWLDASGRRVRRDTVEHLGFELSALKAQRFLGQEQAKPLFESASRVTVTLTAKQGAQALELRAGPACPGDSQQWLVERLRPNPMIGCFSGNLRQWFEGAREHLADDAPFALHADEVESLRIERDGKNLELTRTERGFRLTSPASAEVVLEAGNRRLQAILAASGEQVEVNDPRAFGLDLPSGLVRLKSSVVPGLDQFEEVLELGRQRADGKLPVRRREDSAVLLISRDAARGFTVDSSLLRSLKLLDFGPSELARLELEWGNEHEILERSQTGNFQLVEPRGVEHDGALTLELVQALGTLNAERWIADADDGSFGFLHPQVRARLALSPKAGGSRQITLLIGNKAVDGHYAQFLENPGVFVVENSLVSQLSTLLLSRRVFSQEAASLTKIELERAGRVFTLTRRGAAFIATPELAPGSISRALDALGNLSADAALHTGPARPDEGFGHPSLKVRTWPINKDGRFRAFQLGAADRLHDARAFYARIDGVDATYAIAQSTVTELLNLF